MKLQELFQEPQHKSINELDLFAPKQVYIRMPTGQFVLAKYRSTGSALGSATGEDDPTAFVKFKKVSPEEAETLGLEHHLAPVYSKGKLGTTTNNQPDYGLRPGQGPDQGGQRPLVSPQRVQGGTPFDHPEIDVIAFNKKDRDLYQTLPNGVMVKLIKWVQGGMKEGIEEGVNDPHIFKAVFMAGGPGSGKSYIAQKLTGGTGLKTLNSDIAFKWLMNKANLRLDMPSDEKDERDQVRGRAKEIIKSQEDLYLQGRLGLVIDGTGKDINKISAINAKLKGIGYETRMVFVNADLETSLARNQDRAKQGDRSVDPAIAKDAWSKVQNNMMAYQQEFGANHFYVVDNSDGPPSNERTQSFEAVWKDLQRFLNTAPSDSKATEWMRQQKVSYKRPTKPDRDFRTASPTSFKTSQAAELGKKATIGKDSRRSDKIDFTPPARIIGV
jgi:cytidylate kinase